MAKSKKSKKMTVDSVVKTESIVDNKDGMVWIVMTKSGNEKYISSILANTLINKGSATLK